jgi:hypothetical protein
MASLTAHLRRLDDHGRLGFHPECPICRRERLSGAPPADALVGPRNQALLAASVLALSTASPTAALATTPDQETEGTAPPEQLANDPVQPAAAFDPGGYSTELPVDVAPAPEANTVPEATAETAPLEQEPVADEVVPVADAGDATGVEEQAPAPAADSVPPPAAEPVAPAPPPVPPVPDPPAATHQQPQVESSPPPRAAEESTRASEPKEAQPPAAVAPAQAQGEPVAAAEAPAQLQAEPVAAPEVPSGSAPVRVVQTAHRAAAQPGDRVHVVQRGESLWSIAKDVLGDDASVGRIAREVNRLWELNSERIGTGEPDLVMSGTRITLR